MDRAAFAQMALAEIRRARPDDVVVYDEERFVVRCTSTDGHARIAALSNFFASWADADERARAEIFARIADAALLIDSKEQLDEVRIALVPRIRPRRYFEFDLVRRLEALPEARRATHERVAHYEPLAEHLGITLAIDRRGSLEYVTHPDKYGVDLAELHEIALANLRRTTEGGFQRVADGRWLGSWNDQLAAERMLLPDLFADLGLDGEPVIFLPGAEVIIVVGAHDGAGLAQAMALVEKRLAAPHPLLDLAFVLQSGRWQPFTPRSELGRELGRRLTRHLVDPYAVQKARLEASFEGDDTAPEIPKVITASVVPGGAVDATLTVWAAGARAYLPRVDAIGFRTRDGGNVTVPWEDVMALAGEHLVRVPGLYPARWVTNGYPDDACFELLSGRRVAPEDLIRAGMSRVGTRPAPRWGRLIVGVVLIALVVVLVRLLVK